MAQAMAKQLGIDKINRIAIRPMLFSSFRLHLEKIY